MRPKPKKKKEVIKPVIEAPEITASNTFMHFMGKSASSERQIVSPQKEFIPGNAYFVHNLKIKQA